MSEQTLEAVATPVAEVAETKTPESKPMKYHEYITALEKEVKVFELRARAAKAQFEELQSANQYNQLRAYLTSQAQASQNQENQEDAPTGTTVTPAVEAPNDPAYTKG